METEDITLLDPLHFDLDDATLVDAIEDRFEKSQSKYKDVRARGKKITEYLFGKQIDESKMNALEARYMDNVLYEAMMTIVPIALSRLPDVMVTRGPSETSAKSAKSLTTVLTSDEEKRNDKEVVRLAFRHLFAYLTSVIKARWNPEKGKHGDYEFSIVHPDNIYFDSTATSKDANEHEVLIERIPDLSVKEIMMRFPDKEDEILAEAKIEKDKKTERALSTKYDLYEVWFTWYEQDGKSYKRIEGVAWKFGKTILKKMKNPNFDYEGEENRFIFDTALSKGRELNQEELAMFALSQDMPDLGIELPGLRKETIYHNYFDTPRKPYIILGYDQWGDSPYDRTSILEQNLLKQDNVNIRGKQITDMANRAKLRHIWSGDASVTDGDVEEFALNPDAILKLKDGEDINKIYKQVQGEQPRPELFNDLEMSRKRIFDSMGTSATTRGQKETDTGITAQILREADYGRIDDIVNEVINYAFEEMAKWKMQFIKLRYTAEHMRKTLGKDGKVLFESISRDLIEDGMEVMVSTSSVDKARRERLAMELAKLKLIDPITFFEDMNIPNAKERAEMALEFLTNPDMYMSKYIMELKTPDEMGEALNAPTEPTAPEQAPTEPAQIPAELPQGVV